MHIALNAMFWNQPAVGSGQYLHGLLRGLRQVAPEHHYTLLLPGYLDDERSFGKLRAGSTANNDWPAVNTTHNAQRTTHNSSSGFLKLNTPFDGHNRQLAKLWFEQVAVPRAAARLGADLLHVPYFATPLYCTLPLVTTVGDIIPLVLPEYRGSLAVQAYMALARRAVHHSNQVLTFSAWSRNDIVAQLGVPADRITPVLLAPAERYQPGDQAAARAEVGARYGLHTPFIYYVGGLDARKNVAMLLRACAVLRQRGGPTATLAIAGRALGGDQRLFPDLDRQIAELGLAEIVRRIDVPHADGPLLYQACTLFAWPSRYEGFGLPPLEAMACGAPVVVSNASSLPEAVGNAALLAAPDDLPGWVAALWRLLADAPLRAELRARGLRQAAQFSYTRVAHETLAVYHRAIT